MITKKKFSSSVLQTVSLYMYIFVGFIRTALTFSDLIYCFQKHSMARVCSAHFAPEDLFITPSGKIMRQTGAAPSLFRWTEEQAKPAGETKQMDK